MISIEFILNGVRRELFPVTGAVVDGKRIVGLFRSVEDARSSDADNLADAIVRYDSLTPQQQIVANANAELV